MSFPVWKCTLNWLNTTNNTFAQNVIYMEDHNTPALTPDQVGAKIDDFWWGTTNSLGTCRNFTSTNIKLTSITLQRVFPEPPLGSNPYTTQQRIGGEPSTVKHAVLGLVFTLKDGGAGRRHRGRVYHYGVGNAKVTDAGPTAGNITGTIAACITGWLSAFGQEPTTGLRWVIFHRDQVGDAKFTQVTNIIVNTRLCVQRRRNFGVGI